MKYDFVKYRSILLPVALNDKLSRFPADVSGMFHVTEKIHGMNTQFFTDLNGCNLWGTRNEYIDPELLKFDHPSKEAHIISALQQLQQDNPEYKTFRVFGEFFGGSYPGLKNTNKKIKRGVFYCNERHYLIFDLLINDEFYLSTTDLHKYFGPLCVPILFSGSYSECMSFNPVFESTIYKLYGLEKIENNLAEGVVVKPDITGYVGNSRLAVKLKHEKFKERVRAKEHKEQVPLDDSILELINPNRLMNVLSHNIYELPQDFRTVLKEFNIDVLAEIEEQPKEVNKQINKQCASVIRDYMNEV